QVLVAKPGLCQTTLLFQLLEQFRSSARTAFLFQQQRDPIEFLQSLLSELGGSSGETSFLRLHAELTELLRKAACNRERVIVVLDEAQNLSASVLETIRQLSNFETTQSKLLQVILAGQPPLASKLAVP